MLVSELLNALDCDYGDNMPMYAQTERFGEEWFPIVGIVADANDSTVTLMANMDKGQDRMRSTAFDYANMGSWTDGAGISRDDVMPYELQLSFLFDASRALFPVGGTFSFAEDEDDEESLVLYPA